VSIWKRTRIELRRNMRFVAVALTPLYRSAERSPSRAMGASDHNAPGRPFAPPELRAKTGRTRRWRRMPNARVKVFEDVGHLGHLEATQAFNATPPGFLKL